MTCLRCRSNGLGADEEARQCWKKSWPSSSGFGAAAAGLINLHIKQDRRREGPGTGRRCAQRQLHANRALRGAIRGACLAPRTIGRSPAYLSGLRFGLPRLALLKCWQFHYLAERFPRPRAIVTNSGLAPGNLEARNMREALRPPSCRSSAQMKAELNFRDDAPAR